MKRMKWWRQPPADLYKDIPGTPYREMPPGPPPPRRMKAWHHHLGILLAVTVTDCGLPDHWFHDHPWKLLLIMAGFTIDYRTGYWRGKLEKK